MRINKISKESIFIIFVLLLSLSLRILFLLFLKNNYFFYENPSSDVLYYQAWAKKIAQINWIGTKAFYGLPLYPYFLSILYKITLGNLSIVRFIHLLLGSTNCVLLYLITKKVFSKKIAILSSILMASNFTLIYYDWMMLPVPLLIFLSFIIILSFINSSKIKKSHEWFILGVIIGLTILGDGKILLFLFSVGLYFLFKRNKITKNALLKKCLPLLLGTFIVIGSTGARNKLVSGDWIWISAQSGLSFYAGNHLGATGVYKNPDFIRPTHDGQDEDQIIMAQRLTGKTLNNAQVSAFWKNRGLSFIINSPLEYLKLLKKKFFLFATIDENSYDIDLLFLKNLKKRLNLNPYNILFPLALIGMFLSRKNKKGILFLNLIILSQLLFTLIFFLTNRHRSVILPFLITYEAYVLFWISDQIKGKRWKQLLVPVSVLMILILSLKPTEMKQKTIDFLKFSKSGIIYEKKGNYQKAQGHYFNALKIEPQDTNTLYNLANTYVLKKNFHEAEKYYKKVIELNPIQVDALFNLAYTYEMMEEYKIAIKKFNQVLALEGESIAPHFRLGQIFQKQKKCDQSKYHFQKVLKIDPSLEKQITPQIKSCLQISEF